MDTSADRIARKDGEFATLNKKLSCSTLLQLQENFY
jgi:hypothetical protein